MTDRVYGKPDGLADRLDKWAQTLSRDKSYPWLGTGLYDDLLCAARVLRGQPEPVAAVGRVHAATQIEDMIVISNGITIGTGETQVAAQAALNAKMKELGL